MPSDAEKLVMGYGAYCVWLLICPQRFGHKKTSAREMLLKHIEAQKALRRMFPTKPSTRTMAYIYRREIGETYKMLKDADWIV